MKEAKEKGEKQEMMMRKEMSERKKTEDENSKLKKILEVQGAEHVKDLEMMSNVIQKKLREKKILKMACEASSCDSSSSDSSSSDSSSSDSSSSESSSDSCDSEIAKKPNKEDVE